MAPLNTFQRRMLEGAKNYALADKSDPFAFNRAMTHVGNRIAGRTPNGEDAFYTAEPASETRQLPDGREYQVTVYHNMARP